MSGIILDGQAVSCVGHLSTCSRRFTVFSAFQDRTNPTSHAYLTILTLLTKSMAPSPLQPPLILLPSSEPTLCTSPINLKHTARHMSRTTTAQK